MLMVLVQALCLLIVIALFFYICKAVIDFLQLSRDLSNIVGLILVLFWIVWVLTALGLLPPLPVPPPTKAAGGAWWTGPWAG